jgi:hypothetical protein
MNKIEFDREKYNSLKLIYDKSVSENKEQFVWEGQILLTSYAKYLLEYLENVLGINEKNKKR